MLGPLISFLIALIIVFLLVGLLYRVMNRSGVDPLIKDGVTVVLIILALLCLLYYFPLPR